MIKSFFENFTQKISHYKNKIIDTKPLGLTAIWGAGAKGVTFANLIDPENKYIDCLIDINPKKIGKYTPGTGHPIKSPNVIQGEKYKNIFIMNSNYAPEIIKIFSHTNINFILVDLKNED